MPHISVSPPVAVVVVATIVKAFGPNMRLVMTTSDSLIACNRQQASSASFMVAINGFPVLLGFTGERRDNIGKGENALDVPHNHDRSLHPATLLAPPLSNEVSAMTDAPHQLTIRVLWPFFLDFCHFVRKSTNASCRQW